MKKTVTTLSSLADKVAGRLLLSALFLLFSVATIFSQGVESRLEIGDYSKVEWKSQSDIEASISQENARMDVALTQVDLQETDRAIYQAYKRMLSYTESLIQSGKPVDEAIFEGYEKVLAEAPNDKQLVSMPDGILVTFVPVLVEALAEVPVPDISGQ